MCCHVASKDQEEPNQPKRRQPYQRNTSPRRKPAIVAPVNMKSCASLLQEIRTVEECLQEKAEGDTGIPILC